MNWQELENELDKLAKQIKTKPDSIVGIIRGGIVPARILASKLDVKSMFCINVEKQGQDRKIMSEVQKNLSGLQILLVEDALESGKSLILARDYLETLGAHVSTLAIYIQPRAQIKPDYYLNTKENIPNFPWE